VPVAVALRPLGAGVVLPGGLLVTLLFPLPGARALPLAVALGDCAFCVLAPEPMHG
jgi:hypothetical protein